MPVKSKFYVIASCILTAGLIPLIFLAASGYTNKITWCEPFKIQDCVVIADQYARYYHMKLQVNVKTCNTTASYKESTVYTNCLQAKTPAGFLCYLDDEEKCTLDATTFNVTLLFLLIGSLGVATGILIFISLIVIKYKK